MKLEGLKEPFPHSDISWRIGQAGKGTDKPWAKVLAYIDNRNIQERLDTVVGQANWKNEFTKGPDGGVLCGLSIKIEGEWVTKWDGAENSDIEPIKGGLSDSMKRAAVQWGIGRHLYDLGENWAQIVEKNTPGAHYANCKVKVGGKEEFITFYWLPPRLQADPPKKIDVPPGVTTGDKIKPPEKTAYQGALDAITEAVKAHDREALKVISKRITKSVEAKKISPSEDAMLVTQLSLAEKQIEALQTQPDSAAA